MARKVLAPMVGKILKIKVKVGDQVKENDEIMVIESTKLESGIHAPCDGTVKEIKVYVGDRVEEHQRINFYQDDHLRGGRIHQATGPAVSV